MTRRMKLLAAFVVAIACSCAGFHGAATADKDDDVVCDNDYAIGSHFRERSCQSTQSTSQATQPGFTTPAPMSKGAR